MPLYKVSKENDIYFPVHNIGARDVSRLKHPGFNMAYGGVVAISLQL